MAPAKGSKRRDSKGAAPAAKKAKADPNFDGVVEALEKSADLNEDCRKMLVACMPHCFGVPCDERHACQDDAVRMIGEVIQGVEAALQKATDDESTKVADVEGSKAGLQTALAEAEAAVIAAADEAKAKTEALAEVTKALQAAKTSAQGAEEAQREGDAGLIKAKESKAALEKGESDLRAITEGAGEPEQHYQALLPLLSGLGLDESLMSALPSTCKKSAADRGAFDTMVLEQLGVRLGEQVASLTRAVEDAVPAALERASAAEAAQVELSKAKEAQGKAAEDLEGAKASRQAAVEAAKVAAERLAAFEPEYTRATQERDAKAAALEKFKSYNVACFEQLRNQASSAKVAGGGA